jgi:uncharacterized DUF497 family protein
VGRPQGGANVAKHKVSFDVARLAFADPFGLMREDGRENYGEDRTTLIGIS